MINEPGESEKLSESQQEEFEATVHDPPEEVGIDAPAWTPALAKSISKKPTALSIQSRVVGGC